MLRTQSPAAEPQVLSRFLRSSTAEAEVLSDRTSTHLLTRTMYVLEVLPFKATRQVFSPGAVRTRIDIYNAHIGQYDKTLKGILLIGNKLRLAILVIGNIYRHIGNRRKARLQRMKMHSCSASSTIFNGRLSSATKN